MYVPTPALLITTTPTQPSAGAVYATCSGWPGPAGVAATAVPRISMSDSVPGDSARNSSGSWVAAEAYDSGCSYRSRESVD
ncbi:hypothetical protein FB565_003138 [Actinoplanes lutulentus]|uniref:Uncharacterized protein n=1 Tax=Actinoplanes lutulentus TaxID=1287878 RepID=A0A327Z5S6_9ACTN|nr:hypothetical protein [Actinoplanes lutulentus]MBB2943425.1 hypothetical protein [Actinoplanes lutulentus]RAK26056.1 hypothetical protein B0I29_12992 [Actinoplanes lutulentus]